MICLLNLRNQKNTLHTNMALAPIHHNCTPTFVKPSLFYITQYTKWGNPSYIFYR